MDLHIYFHDSTQLDRIENELKEARAEIRLLAEIMIPHLAIGRLMELRQRIAAKSLDLKNALEEAQGDTPNDNQST